MSNAAESANRSAKQAARSEPVKIAARVGLLAYGITHLLIAFLAVQVALGDSGEQADQTGAFATLAQQPFGVVLLWVLVVGFVAVALWRLELAIWGFAYVDDTTKKIRRRVTAAVKAVLFAALAVLAGSTAAGGGGGGGGGGQGVTAQVLAIPGFGPLLVGAVALVIVVVGIVKIVEGWQQKFRDDMDLPSDRRARQVALRTGQVGFIAKGTSVALIGVLVGVAAIQSDPAEATGLDVALKSLRDQPYGPYLLILVALGLAAYGVFCFFDARYHRV